MQAYIEPNTACWSTRWSARATRRSAARRARRKPAPGADPRSGRWAGTGKIECGLHVMTTRSRTRARRARRPRVRGHPHLPGGRGRVRPAGDPLLRRQGLHAAGAPGGQGVRARAGAVPAAARRHRAQLPGGHRLPRPARRAARPAPARRARRRTGSTTAGSPSAPDGTRNPLQTVPLLDSIVEHRFDAVFGGGRRDEERARAKERIFSLRDAFGRWDPRSQRPELWNLYNGRHAPRRARAGVPDLATGPSWTSGATSRARASSCRRSTTRTSARSSGATACGWPRARGAARAARSAWSAGPCATGPSATARAPARSSPTAATLDEIIAEVTASRLTERGATRADDRLSEAAMEDRKREGYF